ncbi:hypothetical protein NSND_61310 [Nitrospira sp. ND1]|nr:hypothetical protein NSND_61310 [Nitrospira sp. ND1]
MSYGRRRELFAQILALIDRAAFARAIQYLLGSRAFLVYVFT